MAQQPDAGGDDGVIEDTEAGGGSGSCCAVCMEPAEWVAVGPCSHRDVCADCAVRMRFFWNDRRCCICRASCPTVLVTRAGGDGQQHHGAAAATAGFSFSELPPPAAGGVYFSYHGGMAAYFDDQEQYERARKRRLMVTGPPSRSAAVDAAGENNHPLQDPSQGPRWELFVMYLVIPTVYGVATAVPVLMHLQLRSFYQIVLVGAGFALLLAALTHVIICTVESVVPGPRVHQASPGNR